MSISVEETVVTWLFLGLGIIGDFLFFISFGFFIFVCLLLCLFSKFSSPF